MKQKIFANLLAFGMVLSSLNGIAYAKRASDRSSSLKEENKTYRVSDVSDENHYSGVDAIYALDQEVITYDHKMVDEYSITGNLPTYYADQFTTNCANVAGAELIAFYDRTYETLIPNYQVYTILGAYWKYKSQSSNIESVIQELYSLMGTDVGGAGTTFSGFETGMKQYASIHGGYSYKSENLLSSGKFNLENFKKAVEANKPVAVFLPTYTLIDSIAEGTNSDTIYSSYNTLAHAVAACGYRIVTYYNSSNQIIKTKTYIKVASGFILTGLTYIEVETSTFKEVISIIIS